MGRIFKPIIGYEELYQVANTGDIYSNNYGKKKGRFKKLKQGTHRQGYKLIRLYRNNIWRSFMVHRVVALAFIPNPENKPTVNHKDGNKANNHVDNLEWFTQKEQAAHAYETGLKVGLLGSKHPQSKLTEKEVLEIVSDINNGHTLSDLAKKYNISLSTISSIYHGRNWGWLSKDIKKNKLNGNRRKVIMNDTIEFESVNAAARHIGVCPTSIILYIQGVIKNKNKWRYANP